MSRMLVRSAGGIAVGLVALVAVACGGGTSTQSSPSSPTASGTTSNTLPAGWRRCTSGHYGFSVGYPASWHVADYHRLHVLGQGAAYRRQFLQRSVCLNYDPRPFTVYDGSEWPQTALFVYRSATAQAFRDETRWRFDPRYNRTILRQSVVVGGYPAIRYHVFQKNTALWGHSHVYGYLIDFGTRGGVVIQAWRYGSRPVPWDQYHSYMQVADQMAATARIDGPSHAHSG